MTDTKYRPIDLIAKVAGVSLRRTFFVLRGVQNNDLEKQQQFGKRTMHSVLNAYKTVAIYAGGDLEIDTVLPWRSHDVPLPTSEEVVACAQTYRDMVDKQYV